MTMPFYVPPEQLVKDRADFARKGIARGRSIAAVEYATGILLLAENPSGTLHKISEIYDRIAFAGVGKFNEFELLRVAGIRHADVKGYMYSRSDVSAKSLVNAFAQTLGNIFTHEVKPFEVELLVAELGVGDQPNRMYRVLYDGTLYDQSGFAAIGGNSEELSERLEAAYRPGLSLEEAVRLAAGAFENGVEGWEGAILDRNGHRRAFRKLTAEEIAECIAAA
ncbi:MAG: proteasome subunit alpha [Acidimicrobiia bacterium]|nr:proteasome subunit alpha [Acidimicrobiia bacterium]MDH5422845.1 proteasome subunit alpha [Acidimicrobiia bacterium]MDH5503991.1 proteasome subunit alpha [Acidimicrobiia bacterium]